MNVVEAVRERLSRPPSRYERGWFRSVNAVGVVVLAAALFDVQFLLGAGRTGVFQRALYPLVPPAFTLGLATNGGTRRQLLLSAGALAAYALTLALVGTLGTALATAPVYPAAGLALAAAGVVAGRLWP